MLTTGFNDARGRVIESVEHIDIDGKQYELKIITRANAQNRVQTDAFGCMAYNGFCIHDMGKDFRQRLWVHHGNAAWHKDKVYQDQHASALRGIDRIRDLMRTHYAVPVS